MVALLPPYAGSGLRDTLFAASLTRQSREKYNGIGHGVKNITLGGGGCWRGHRVGTGGRLQHEKLVKLGLRGIKLLLIASRSSNVNTIQGVYRRRGEGGYVVCLCLCLSPIITQFTISFLPSLHQSHV